jgi:hypothetical protein
MRLFFLLCFWAVSSCATPLFKRDDGSDFTPVYIPSPEILTWPLFGSPDYDKPASAFDLDFEQPIGASSYFSISSDCFSDTRNMDGSGFPNRGAFYQQAYKDATTIASAASGWPLRDIDASDLYFGKETEKAVWSDDITGV